jgi:nicotinamidase-related amidase
MDTPSFFDPASAGLVYAERAGVVAAAAASATPIAPARSDTFRVCAFGIDCQVAFAAPTGSLFVPGAVEDTQRATQFLYNNLERITELVFSLDTHTVFQIFHPGFWLDEKGQHPAPFSVVTHDDVAAGRLRPRRAEDLPACLEYTKKLAASGKYVLTLWPYHALLGGVSHALMPCLAEAAMYHALLRDQPTVFETKGEHELTENYSVLAPEVTEINGTRVGAFNQSLFDRLLSHDRVYVFGQAKSHCVLSTLRDLRDHILAKDPSAMGKVHIVVDAMSPVPAPPVTPLPPALDFPRLADEGIAELEKAGMQLVRADAVIAP